MITTLELEGLKAALIEPLSSFDSELMQAAQDNIDTVVGLHCMTCSGDVMLLYLRCELDILTIAQDYSRNKVDVSTQTSSKSNASRSDGFNEKHATAHANAAAVQTQWSKLVGQRQWLRTGESHQNMGMNEGANSSGSSSASSTRTETKGASGKAVGLSQFSSHAYDRTYEAGNVKETSDIQAERSTHKKFGGQMVQGQIGLSLFAAASGKFGMYDGTSKSKYDINGDTTTIFRNRFGDSSATLNANGHTQLESRDTSTMNRTAHRFSESNRSGSASMNMGLSGNSQQHADAQSASDSSAHADSQANSEMAAEMKAHSETAGKEQSDSSRIVTVRKWAQIATNLAALFVEVQQQYDDYIARLAANVRPASVYMHTQLPELSRSTGAWLPVLRGEAFRCRCAGPCKCGLRNGLATLNPLPIPQP